MLTQISDAISLYQDETGRIVYGVGGILSAPGTLGNLNAPADVTLHGAIYAHAGYSEHVLNADRAHENTLRIKNDNPLGWSAVAFDAPGVGGHERLAVGCTNGVVNEAFGPPGTGYIEASDFSGASKYGTLRVVQTNPVASHWSLRLELQENGDFVFYDRSIPRKQVLRVSESGDVVIGKQSQPTSATSGFPCIPTCDGPMGSSPPIDGSARVVWDKTNHVLCVYDGEWHGLPSIPYKQAPVVIPPPPGEWSPLSLGAALELWCDDASGIVQSAGHVSQWSDASGKGNHLAQANTAFQPTIEANAQNGLPVVRCDDTDDCLVSPLTKGQIGAAMWIAAIVIPRTTNIQREWYGLRNPVTHHQWLCGATTGSKARSSCYDGAEHPAVAQAAFVPGTAYCFVHAFNADSVSLYVNGVLQQTVAAGNPSIGNDTPFIVGKSYYPAEADIGEVMVVSGVPSSGDIASASAYLISKWRFSERAGCGGAGRRGSNNET